MSMNPEMEAKYFTLEQANRSLPLVRRVVTDIVDEFAEWPSGSLSNAISPAVKSRPW